jgi:hypothetical protein
MARGIVACGKTPSHPQDLAEEKKKIHRMNEFWMASGKHRQFFYSECDALAVKFKFNAHCLT